MSFSPTTSKQDIQICIFTLDELLNWKLSLSSSLNKIPKLSGQVPLRGMGVGGGSIQGSGMILKTSSDLISSVFFSYHCFFGGEEAGGGNLPLVFCYTSTVCQVFLGMCKPKYDGY